MSFPLNPTNGQSVTIRGVVYTFNSTKGSWRKSTTGSGVVPVAVSGNLTAGNIATTGLLSVTGNANVGNLGTTGTVTTDILSVTGNANVGNLETAGTVTASRLISNVATGTAPFTVTSTTQVANLNSATAGTVRTAAQPNITSVGTLTSLTVSGNITISDLNSYVNLSEVSDAVGSAPAGDVAIFSRSIGGRYMLSAVGPTGLDYQANPHMGRNRIKYIAPVGNATTVPDVFPGTQAFTAVGTATARNWASTNILTRATRLGYVSAATAGSLSSLRWAAAQFSTGNGSGLGGFHYMARFGITDAVTGARMFVGVSSNTGAATNVEPSTLTNSVGLAKLAADTTQWYIVYGGSAAQTAIALGTGLGAPTLTDTLWEVILFASPNQNGVVGYQVTNLGTNVRVVGTLTPATPGTQTPASTTALTAQIWRTNNATATAVGIDFSMLYVETDN